MEKIIFSEFPPDLLQHFYSVESKFNSNRVKPQTPSTFETPSGISLLLLDMVTFSRIETPIRGNNCQHMECFDESSIEFLVGEECPFCKERFESSEKDEYLMEVLKWGSFEGIYIVFPYGLYFPLKRKTQEILWDMETLKFIAIRNAQNGEKSFSYTNEKTGINRLEFEISLDKLIKIPCRTRGCTHLTCYDLEELWQCRICPECGGSVNESNIYVDLVQYAVVLFILRELRNKDATIEDTLCTSYDKKNTLDEKTTSTDKINTFEEEIKSKDKMNTFEKEINLKDKMNTLQKQISSKEKNNTMQEEIKSKESQEEISSKEDNNNPTSKDKENPTQDIKSKYKGNTFEDKSNPLEDIKRTFGATEILTFSYFPEYACFKVLGRFFDLHDLQPVSPGIQSEILTRVTFWKDMSQFGENTTRKEDKNNDLCGFLDDFEFSYAATPILELNFCDVEEEIGNFLRGVL